MWIGLFNPFICWIGRGESAIYGRFPSCEKRWLWMDERPLCMKLNSGSARPEIGHPTSGLIKKCHPISGFSRYFAVGLHRGFSTIT